VSGLKGRGRGWMVFEARIWEGRKKQARRVELSVKYWGGMLAVC
jgi:hypothetical protein